MSYSTGMLKHRVEVLKRVQDDGDFGIRSGKNHFEVVCCAWAAVDWKQAMAQNELDLESEPDYNKCALFVTMSMVMSDSKDTIEKYVEDEDMFNFVHDLAVDKLTDEDNVFNVREYFKL